MATGKTKKYIVTRMGTCLKGTEVTPVGTKVNLTESKAAAMVGKVRLLADYEADNKSDADLKKENAKLVKENAALTAQVETLTALLPEDKK